jgi:hypothetical protein
MGAPGLLCDLAFSPDGKRLAGASRDVVKLWEAGTGQELLTLRGAPPRHRDPAFNPRVRFSPAGTRLAGSNWDESISVWEAPEQAEEAPGAWREARRRAARARAPLWHLQEAERCLEHKNPLGADFHLRQLGARPLPGPLEALKERLLRRRDS